MKANTIDGITARPKAKQKRPCWRNHPAGVLCCGADNILWFGCERRIATIEDIVARDFTNKVGHEQFSKNFEFQKNEFTEQIILKQIDSIAFMLFLYSLIFRMYVTSVGFYKSFSINKELNENLRLRL